MNLLETYGRYLSNDWGLAYELLCHEQNLVVVSKDSTGVIMMSQARMEEAPQFWVESDGIFIPPFDCWTVQEFVGMMEFDSVDELKFLVPPGVVSRRQDRESHIPEKPQHQGPPIGMRDSITSIEGGTV